MEEEPGAPGCPVIRPRYGWTKTLLMAIAWFTLTLWLANRMDAVSTIHTIFHR